MDDCHVAGEVEVTSFLTSEQDVKFFVIRIALFDGAKHMLQRSSGLHVFLKKKKVQNLYILEKTCICCQLHYVLCRETHHCKLLTLPNNHKLLFSLVVSKIYICLQLFDIYGIDSNQFYVLHQTQHF